MEKVVSVIINTKNEEKNIARCLESVQKQNYPQDQIEIIVVDNDSTDRTKEIAGKHTRLIFNYGPERSAQKNFGVGRSGGQYFIHLDADMELSGGVILECVKKIENDGEIVALNIPEIVVGKKFFSRARKFERSFYNNTVIDGVRFIKKNKFLAIGGFDEDMHACEDWDLTKRIKKTGKIDTIRAPLFHNEVEFNLKRYLKKKKYYSGNMDVYIEKWGKDDQDVKKQFGIYYRFFGVFLENGKWKRLVAHPILAAGMYFLRFWVGVNFLLRDNG